MSSDRDVFTSVSALDHVPLHEDTTAAQLWRLSSPRHYLSSDQ